MIRIRRESKYLACDRIVQTIKLSAMNDTDIIKKSYEQLIQQIFDAYWNDAFVGSPPPNQVQQAEAKFQKGVTNARKARDRAIALLPP